MFSRNSKYFLHMITHYIDIYYILPNNSTINIIEKIQDILELKQSLTLQRQLGIQLIIKKKKITHIEFTAGVYEVPCLDCHKKYPGETSCSINEFTSTREI